MRVRLDSDFPAKTLLTVCQPDHTYAINSVHDDGCQHSVCTEVKANAPSFLSSKTSAMEVVLGVVVLSQAAIFASDALLKRRDAPATSPPAASASAPEATNGNEGSTRARVAELEARLASLKAQARDANSPDTFVQYARLTREANTVEKELISLRGAFPSRLASWLNLVR